MLQLNLMNPRVETEHAPSQRDDSEGKYDNFEQILASCGEFVTQVRGVSMYPMLRYRKDPVLIHPLTEELKHYDVAVYASNDRYVVHRVLETQKDIYIIRGDNCIGKEYVPKENVRGVVVGFWRFGKYIPVTNRLYLMYAHLWVAINPLVRATHYLKALPRRGKKFIKKYLVTSK